MDALIQITTDGQGSSVVSGRELHSFLAVKKQFADWIKHRIDKYGLVEGRDYSTFSLTGEKGRPMQEYALTLDTAKELAMVEGNEQGKAARAYFLTCEKQLRTLAAAPAPATDPVLLQILQNQSQLMVEQQAQLNQLRADVAQIQTGQRPARQRPALPGVRSARPGQAQLRAQINQQIGAYCEHYNATPGETYRYLYGRLQSVFGLNIYGLSRRSGESLLDAIDRYGYLNQLNTLIQSELNLPEQP